MNLINKGVEHGTFGKGKVVSQTEDYIKISFESGIKKFVFPDVFGKYMTLIDEEASEIIDKKIEVQEAREEAEALELRKARALERQRQQILNREKGIQSGKVNPKLQSVFWCDAEEAEKVFEDWQVFVGEIKSGAKKGQPRKLARMNPKSACLITKRTADMEEEDRYILGAFLVESTFDGREADDGYIKAHPEHRIRLTKEESEKMLFWNYYKNRKFPKRMTWNSGKQRYFDNMWMAQILKDIVDMREDEEEKKAAQEFLEYFCRINHIISDELPKPQGALMHEDEEEEKKEGKDKSNN